MRKILCIAALLYAFLNSAQVGINTELPNATLDVTGNGISTTAKDGIVAPRVSRQQLAAKTAGTYTAAQTGSLVYVNDITAPAGTVPSAAQAAEVIAIGYYYFNGSVWKQMTVADTSLYSGDGTLAGNRIVTQGPSALAFTASSVNAFSVDGTTLSVDASGNRVGIGTVAPVRTLHVNTAADPVRFENLPALPVGATSNTLVIDGNGDIYKNTTPSIEGQILRIGLNGQSYAAGSELPLRFNLNDSAAEMGNAPNSAPNFINAIVGATITDGIAVAAGNGAPARTTDQITLPMGVYKVQLRIVGNFPFAADVNNNASFKCIVGNSEYSLINIAIPGTTQVTTHYFEDYINISAASQPLDFTIIPSVNTFTTADKGQPAGGGNSYRSLLTIQRIK